MADLDAALAWLAGQRPAMEALLARLVRQNSFTRNVAGANAVVTALDAELGRLGLARERIPGDRFGDHLYFETRAQGAPVFLVGHTDTVFPPGDFEGWSADGA
ncbi:MAG TPA: M20 family peptidase, partial [Anaeromyxobacteraceae bacterium]